MANIEKLQRLADHLRSSVDPLDFDMDHWAVKNFDDHGNCHTACCIAGTQMLLDGYSVAFRDLTVTGFLVPPGGRTRDSVWPVSAYDSAMRSLDLTGAEADLLFYRSESINDINGWPLDEFGNQIFPETPDGAADRIEYFINTGL